MAGNAPQIAAGPTAGQGPNQSNKPTVEREPSQGGTPNTESRVELTQKEQEIHKIATGKLNALGINQDLANKVVSALSPENKEKLASSKDLDPSALEGTPSQKELTDNIKKLNKIWEDNPKTATDVLIETLENTWKEGKTGAQNFMKAFTQSLSDAIKNEERDDKKEEEEKKKKEKELEQERERLEQQLKLQRDLNREQNIRLKENFKEKYNEEVRKGNLDKKVFEQLSETLETQSELLTQEEFHNFTKQLDRLIARDNDAIITDTLSVLTDSHKFDQGDQSTCVACTMANVAIRSGRADKLLELLNKQLDDPKSTLNEKGYRKKVLSAKSDMKGGILAAALMEVASDNMFKSDGRTGLANGQTTYGLTDSQIAKLYKEVFGEKGLVVPRAELGATDAEFANNLSNLLKENNGAVFAKLVWGEGGNQHSLHAITITKVEDGIVHFENSQGEEFSQQMSVTEFRARLQFTISENATGFEDKAVKITELKDNTIPVTMNGQVLSIEDGDISYKLSKDPKKDEEEREEALRGIFSEESIKAFKEIWEKSKKDEETPVESMIITDDGTKKVTDDTPKEQGDDKETSSKKKGLFG